MKSKRIAYVIILVFLFIWFILLLRSNCYEPYQLQKDGCLTVGEITSYDRAGRSTPYTNYKYMVNNKIYSESMQGWLSNCPEDQRCVGAKFCVLYSKSYPKIHRLLINQKLNDTLIIGQQILPTRSVISLIKQVLASALPPH